MGTRDRADRSRVQSEAGPTEEKMRKPPKNEGGYPPPHRDRSPPFASLWTLGARAGASVVAGGGRVRGHRSSSASGSRSRPPLASAEGNEPKIVSHPSRRVANERRTMNPPRLAKRIANKMAWYRSSRLGTRTKESNVCASVRVMKTL